MPDAGHAADRLQPSAVGGDAPAASRRTAGGVGTAGMAFARAWNPSADNGGSYYRDEYSRGIFVPGISKKMRCRYRVNPDNDTAAYAI